METDIKTRYGIKKISNDEYQLSIAGKMQWIGGFFLFMFFLILLTLAFFIPIGYNVKEYLKIVIPLFLVFTAIALFAGFFFKKSTAKTFVFNAKNFTIRQSKKTPSENWEILQLPKKGVIVRDSYKYRQKNLSLGATTVGTSDIINYEIINMNRLMIIPTENFSSDEDITEVIKIYNKYKKDKIYNINEKAELPENAILVSTGRFTEYQDLIIEGLIKIFDWKLVDFLTSPPEIYDKKTLETATIHNIQIEKPEKTSLLKEKNKNNEIIITLRKIPMYLKFIMLFLVAIVSAFYAFFAGLKNDTNFWLAFFPMFILWVLILSITTRINITENAVCKRAVMLGLPILWKEKVNLEDIGDIKILKENNFKLVFYKKGGRQTLFSITVPNKAAGEYIIYRIKEISANRHTV